MRLGGKLQEWNGNRGSLRQDRTGSPQGLGLTPAHPRRVDGIGAYLGSIAEARLRFLRCSCRQNETSHGGRSRLQAERNIKWWTESHVQAHESDRGSSLACLVGLLWLLHAENDATVKCITARLQEGHSRAVRFSEGHRWKTSKSKLAIMITSALDSKTIVPFKVEPVELSASH